MRFPLVALSALGLLIATSSLSFAQSPPPAAGQPQRVPFRQRFATANTTHDGCLTLQQAQAGGLRGVARNFTAIDTAHHGCVTMHDMRAFNRQRRAMRQQQGASAPPAPAPGASTPPQ